MPTGKYLTQLDGHVLFGTQPDSQPFKLTTNMLARYSKRRGDKVLQIVTVRPEMATGTGDFQLLTKGARLAIGEYVYRQPAGLLILENLSAMSGNIIPDPDHLGDPAIPIFYKQLDEPIVCTSHQPPVYITG